jgi:hypothetical protein
MKTVPKKESAGLAVADFTAWVESCTTFDALREAAASVNRMSAIVQRRLATLTDTARTAFRVGARVVLTVGRKSGERSQDRDTVGTIIKMTAKYAHVSLDSHEVVRVGFIGIELLPDTDPRYSEAAREEALAQATQQHQRALDKAKQWRKEHVSIIGMTDEQRTKMEKGLDADLAAGR